MTPSEIDINTDMSEAMRASRRKMRAKLLALGDSELWSLYYQTLMLCEHEAARKAYTEMND